MERIDHVGYSLLILSLPMHWFSLSSSFSFSLYSVPLLPGPFRLVPSSVVCPSRDTNAGKEPGKEVGGEEGCFGIFDYMIFLELVCIFYFYLYTCVSVYRYVC